MKILGPKLKMAPNSNFFRKILQFFLHGFFIALIFPVHEDFFSFEQKRGPEVKIEKGVIFGGVKNEFFLMGENFFQSSITRLKIGARKSFRPFSESSDRQLSNEHITFLLGHQ